MVINSSEQTILKTSNRALWFWTMLILLFTFGFFLFVALAHFNFDFRNRDFLFGLFFTLPLLIFFAVIVIAISAATFEKYRVTYIFTNQGIEIRKKDIDMKKELSDMPNKFYQKFTNYILNKSVEEGDVAAIPLTNRDKFIRYSEISRIHVIKTKANLIDKFLGIIHISITQKSGRRLRLSNLIKKNFIVIVNRYNIPIDGL